MLLIVSTQRAQLPVASIAVGSINGACLSPSPLDGVDSILANLTRAPVTSIAVDSISTTSFWLYLPEFVLTKPSSRAQSDLGVAP